MLGFMHLGSFLNRSSYLLYSYSWGFLKGYLRLSNEWVMVCFLFCKWGFGSKGNPSAFVYRMLNSNPHSTQRGGLTAKAVTTAKAYPWNYSSPERGSANAIVPESLAVYWGKIHSSWSLSMKDNKHSDGRQQQVIIIVNNNSNKALCGSW
jgi:hypothetical protein